MNIPKAYIGGFQKAAKSPRMLLILYIANLFTALLLALPFMGLLKDGFGSSKLFENSLDGFDINSFINLIYYQSDGLMTILGSVKWYVLAYFLLNIFLTGGIFRILNREKFRTSDFFAGSAYNFFRFLGLSAIVLLLQVIVLLLVYIPVGMLIESYSQNLSSEVKLYYVGISGFVLHLLLFLMVSMIGDYGKCFLVLNDSFNIFKGFWKGTKYVFGHFLKTYFLYLFLLFIPAVVMYVYLYFENDMKMATGIGILIVFGMQQGFMLLRVFLRVWILASQFKMYADDYLEPSLVQNILFSVVDTKKSNEEKVIEGKKEESVQKSEKKGYSIDFDKTFASENELIEDGNILTEEQMLEKAKNEENGNQVKKAVIEEKLEEKKSVKETLISEEKTESEVVNKSETPEIEAEKEIEEEHNEIIQNVESQAKVETKAEDTQQEEITASVKNEENIHTENNEEIEEPEIEEALLSEIQNELAKMDESENMESEIEEGDIEQKMAEEFSDSDNDDEDDDYDEEDEHHTSEIDRVEQNVVEPDVEENTVEENKKKNDDMIEFEL